jgi:hypothetical protein
LRARAPATADALWTPRRGTSSACAKRTHPTRAAAVPLVTGDTSFTRSKGPCTSIVTQLRRRKSQEVTRSRWYRGRANPRKREEPAPGSSRTDVARLAACLPHRGATHGGCVARQKRKGVAASVPARNRELRLGCPYVVRSCRSRQATLGLEYSRARSSKKSLHASERGPSPGHTSAVTRRRGSRAKRRRDVERHRTSRCSDRRRPRVT